MEITIKTFKQIAKTYGYTPMLSKEKVLYGLSRGKLRISNILTFREKPGIKCEVSQKNTEKILKRGLKE